MRFCLERSKGWNFHKARYRLARSFDERGGDLPKAVAEMRALFQKGRTTFCFAVATIDDLQEMQVDSRMQESSCSMCTQWNFCSVCAFPLLLLFFFSAPPVPGPRTAWVS